jgi:hypothetical protein
MTKAEIIEVYQNWYLQKFNEKAVLTDEILLRGFGHIRYVYIVLVLFEGFNDKETFLKYCDFIFDNWSSVNGTGAMVRYFPNWLASSSMKVQFKDYLKTMKIKERNCTSHPTYSEHSYVGKSVDVPLFEE